MKTLILAAAAAMLSSSVAFAQEAPIYAGDYDASTSRQFDVSSEDNGQFMLDFSSSASATANTRTGQANYGATVDVQDIYSGR